MQLVKDWHDGDLKGTYDFDNLQIPGTDKFAHRLTLDELYSELKPLNIGAKPSMGKHELCMALARHLKDIGAVKQNITVVR